MKKRKALLTPLRTDGGGAILALLAFSLAACDSSDKSTTTTDAGWHTLVADPRGGNVYVEETVGS